MKTKLSAICMCTLLVTVACSNQNNTGDPGPRSTDSDSQSASDGDDKSFPSTSPETASDDKAMCTTDESCPEDQFCQSGACQPQGDKGERCQRDRECRLGLRCHFLKDADGLFLSQCHPPVPGAWKKAAEDCTKDLECLNNNCHFYRSTCAAPCLYDSDCPQGALCQDVDLWFEHTVKSCLPGCKKESDCPNGYSCEEGRCAISFPGALGSPCLTSADCQKGSCWASNNGICIANCDVEPCDDGLACVPFEEPAKGHYCLPTCATNEDCRKAWRCKHDDDNDLHYCTHKCLHDGYCESDEYCHNSGRCLSQPCLTNDDCQDGRVCKFLGLDTNGDNSLDQGYIGCGTVQEDATKNLGEFCTSWRQCKTGWCAYSRGRCSQPCGNDDHCPPGFVCDRFIANYETTVWGCTPDCRFTPCPDGLTCEESGRCTALGSDGFIQSPCVETGDCRHGYCNDLYGSSCHLTCETNPSTCPSGSVCSGQSCAPSCETHDDCRSFKKCKLSKDGAVCKNFKSQLKGHIQLENEPRPPPPLQSLPHWIVANKIVVKWRPQNTTTKIPMSSIVGRRFRVMKKPSSQMRAAVVKFDKPFATLAELRDALAVLNDDAAVEYAEPLFRRYKDAIPNDPDFDNQWWLHELGCQNAWDHTQGSREVVVAVLDTGIVSEHPDLRDRLVQGADLVSEVENSGDGDGRDLDPEDENLRGCGNADGGFHGTSVAGIIGAASNNGVGGVGIDWNARIQPVRVLGCESGLSEDIADGIRWAAGLPVDGLPLNSTPAKIINLSLGGIALSTAEFEAIAEATARGAIVVSSAGNDAGLAEARSPAGIPGVISVAALEMNKTRSIYSSHGDGVDIAAYGGDYFSDYNGDRQPDAVLTTDAVLNRDSIEYETAYFNGTSAAAPMVSGALSLMAAVYPEIDPATAIWILKQTADPDISCDKGCGAGALQIDRAVEMARESSLNPERLPDLVASQDVFKAWLTEVTYQVVLANHSAALSQFDVIVEGPARDAIRVQNVIEILPNDSAVLTFNVENLPDLDGIREAEIVITALGVEKRIRVVTHHGNWRLDTIPYFYVTAYEVIVDGEGYVYDHLDTTSTNAALDYEFLLRFSRPQNEIIAQAYAFFTKGSANYFSGEEGERLLLTHSQIVESYNLSMGPYR